MPDAALRKALIDALLSTEFIQNYDWLGTSSSYPTNEQIRDELGALADQLMADPAIEIHLHVCAACRWEQGFGAVRPLEHTCVARKGQPTAPDVDLDEHFPEGYPVLRQEYENRFPEPKRCRAAWTSGIYGPVRCGQAEGHIGTHRPSEHLHTWLVNLPNGGLPIGMGAHWLPEDVDS